MRKQKSKHKKVISSWIKFKKQFGPIINLGTYLEEIDIPYLLESARKLAENGQFGSKVAFKVAPNISLTVPIIDISHKVNMHQLTALIKERNGAVSSEKGLIPAHWPPVIVPKLDDNDKTIYERSLFSIRSRGGVITGIKKPSDYLSFDFIDSSRIPVDMVRVMADENLADKSLYEELNLEDKRNIPLSDNPNPDYDGDV